MCLPRGVIVLFVGLASFASIASAETLDCAALAKRPVPDATIQAELFSNGTFKPPAGDPLGNLPEFCRVRLIMTPSADSSIQAEVWLPTKGWNGKLQGVGNGGFAGSISYGGLAEALRLNYATVSTDTGHEADGIDATWASHHPEKIADFGYRSIHLMTVDAKELIRSFYGTDSKRAYFNACSNGGRQALMEAQRFPNDYDGIIAGAPANYWTHLVSNAVVNVQALLSNKANYIPSAKLPAIQAAVQQACDLNDGVKDNLIENPSRCRFDTSVLLCKGEDSNSCLTQEQVMALKQLYSGGHYSNGAVFFPGYPAGGEAAKGNWDLWITGDEPGKSLMYAFGTQFFKNMVYSDSKWDFHSFRPDKDVKLADRKLALILNSTNPDLRPFIAHGGKLILYHGWDDAAIAAPNSIHYFQEVQKRLGSLRASESVRLFMVPGMQHCSGGNGASSFGQFGAGAGDAGHDIDTALVEWVELGKAPERLVASKPGSDVSHPICAYPKTAHYNGSGDVNSASSYSCGDDIAK